MNSYKCKVCNHIYDPAKGDQLSDIPPSTAFEELPDDWKCPICGVDKSHFTEVEKADDNKTKM